MAIEMVNFRTPYYELAPSDAPLNALQGSLVQEIAKQQKPVLSDDMVLLMRAGQEVPIEPSIFRDLALTGKWDESPYVSAIADHRFAFVVQNPSYMVTLYTPAVEAAIERAYPRVEMRGGYVIRYPGAS